MVTLLRTVWRWLLTFLPNQVKNRLTAKNQRVNPGKESAEAIANLLLLAANLRTVLTDYQIYLTGEMVLWITGKADHTEVILGVRPAKDKGRLVLAAMRTLHPKSEEMVDIVRKYSNLAVSIIDDKLDVEQLKKDLGMSSTNSEEKYSGLLN